MYQRIVPSHDLPAHAGLSIVSSTASLTNDNQSYPLAPLLKAQASLSHHKALVESRVKLQTFLKGEKVSLSTQIDNITRMEDTRRAYCEQLKTREQSIQGLRRRLKDMEVASDKHVSQIQFVDEDIHGEKLRKTQTTGAIEQIRQSLAITKGQYGGTVNKD
jgi:hypothetical protein